MRAPPPALLAPGYREAPLWHDDVDVDVAPAGGRGPSPGPLPAEADVVVVGGGYCGVSAAAELAVRGRQVVLVEAGVLGAGASTRNGGMVIPELKYGPRHLAAKFGPLGGELVDAVFDAFDLVERLVEEWEIECAYARTGGLLLAHHPAQVAGFARALHEWRDDLGLEAHLLGRDELRSEIGSDRYHAGLVTERTGGLQPARYHAGLVRVASERGASLHEHAAALRIEACGGRTRVHTTAGEIDAGDVFVATNAYADGLIPALQSRVLPIGSFIVATEPMEAALAESCIPRGRMVFDAKNFLFYWRRTADHRIVFGGRTSLASTTVPRARDVLYAELLDVHPQLAGAALARAWGGSVAMTMDRLPHCGRLPIPGGGSVAYATGCNGTGVALATWFGFRAAAWLTGDEPPPAFAELPVPKIPLHRARERYLPAVGWWFRARDRYGR